MSQPTGYHSNAMTGSAYTGHNDGVPGAVKTIGVLSIVVASVTMLACFIEGAVHQWMHSAAAAIKLYQGPPNQPRTGVPAASASDASTDGYNARDREVIVAGLRRVRPLSDARQQQLAAMLADSGRLILPLVGQDMQVEQIAANVSEHGQLPSARPNEEGTDYFVLGRGRLEVGDNNAVFFPADGGETIRTQGVIASPGDDGTMLSEAQITAVVAQIETLAGRPLTDAHKSGVRTALQTPGQQFILPSPSVVGATNQVVWATIDPNGSLVVATTSNSITIAGDGTVNAGRQAVNFSINRSAALLALMATAMAFVLAVFLLVAGVATMRRSPYGAVLHWIYVVAKIPLAVLTAFAAWRLWTSMQETPESHTTTAVVWGVITLLACAYPVLLAILLLQPNVRAYYRTAS